MDFEAITSLIPIVSKPNKMFVVVGFVVEDDIVVVDPRKILY